jgi:hypothetical protein
MNRKTLKALKGSIQKWHDISYHGAVDHGDDDCPLCMEFNRPPCIGCPVMWFTGIEGCLGTPYNCDGMNKARKVAMLKFLVNLLPTGESAEMKDGWVWYMK